MYLRLILLTLLLVSSLGAQTFTVDPSVLINPKSKLGSEFDKMNRHITQIHAVKSLPFFKLSHSQRYDRLSSYATKARGGQMKSLGGDVSKDFFQGGIVKDVGIVALTSVMTRMAQGETLDESISNTWEYVTTSQFFFGQIFGGMFGAALGAMIPVPMIGGLAGQIIGGVPMMTGAMLGGTLGYNLIDQIKAGDVNLVQLLQSVDYVNLFCQALGSTIGMTVGTLLPVPGLGSVIGGVIGGNLGMRFAMWLRQKAGFGAKSEARPSSTTVDGSGVVDSGNSGESSSTGEKNPLVGVDPKTLEQIRDNAYAQFQNAHEANKAQEALLAYQLYTQAHEALVAAGL
mgnify:CR=1 FL=1